MNDIIAPKIKEVIVSKGLKQCVVAERAGYTKQQFSDMMSGRKMIKDSDILKIANTLNVDANTLFGMKAGCG